MHYQDYFDLLINLKSHGKSITEVDSIQKQILYGILNNSYGSLQAWVRNVLINADSINYNEPYLLPETGLKFGSAKPDPENKKYDSNLFKLYPNPAGNYVIIEYCLKQEPKNCFVEFINVQGKPVKSISIQETHNYLIVPLVDFVNGVYFCSFFINGTRVETVKLSIAK